VGGEWTIDADVACEKCGYNVRTLNVTARCPECGFPVLRSFIGHEARGRTSLPDARRVVRTAQLVIARLLGRNVDSVDFVMRVHRYAAQTIAKNRLGLRTRPQDIPASDLCRAVVDYALEHYRNATDAVATLQFWRLTTSDDLGQIVAALVEAGLILPGEHDTPADFVGVCRFEEMLRGE